jgi:hypothetical protein
METKFQIDNGVETCDNIQPSQSGCTRHEDIWNSNIGNESHKMHESVSLRFLKLDHYLKLPRVRTSYADALQWWFSKR